MATDTERLRESGTLKSKFLSQSSSEGKTKEFLQQEVTLGEQVRQAGFSYTDLDVTLHLLELSTKSRKAYVLGSDIIAVVEGV